MIYRSPDPVLVEFRETEWTPPRRQTAAVWRLRARVLGVFGEALRALTQEFGVPLALRTGAEEE